MSMPTSPFNPVTHAPIKAAILYNFSMQSPKMGRNFPKPRSGNRLKIVMKQSSCRSRSAADAQRANCEAPERTGADRRRQPCYILIMLHKRFSCMCALLLIKSAHISAGIVIHRIIACAMLRTRNIDNNSTFASKIRNISSRTHIFIRD